MPDPDVLTQAQALLRAARNSDSVELRAYYAAAARLALEKAATELASLQTSLKGIEQSLGTLGGKHVA